VGSLPSSCIVSAQRPPSGASLSSHNGHLCVCNHIAFTPEGRYPAKLPKPADHWWSWHINPISPELPRSSVGGGNKAVETPPSSLQGKVVPSTSRYSMEGTRPLTHQAHPHLTMGVSRCSSDYARVPSAARLTVCIYIATLK
jgi:hypothetical protein